jgi:hypothetical protein
MMEPEIMNESANTTAGDATDADADAVRRAKVDALQRRRTVAADPSAARRQAATTAPQRNGASRNGVAQGSKIAATAMGMTAMLAIVGGMSIAAQRKTNAAPTPAAPAQVVVVIHPAAPGAAGAATGATGVQTPGRAIALSAQPVVRQAASSAAPVAKTSGSH